MKPDRAGREPVHAGASVEVVTDAAARGFSDASLAAYVAAARAAFTGPSVGDDVFRPYVLARARQGRLPDPSYAGDLLLACSCTLRIPAAVAAFHERYDGLITRVLSRRRATGDVLADAAQIVYERLLVGAPGVAPKIGEYAGSGPLRAWVSTVAATTLLMLRRAAARRREESPAAEESLEAVTAAEPELRYLQARYKVELEGALLRAIERLTDRQKLLLRLHLGESLSIDALGAMYSVNRATAARWLAAARAAILAATREELTKSLQLAPGEWESIVALVRSRISVSVLRHLGPGAPPSAAPSER